MNLPMGLDELLKLSKTLNLHQEGYGEKSFDATLIIQNEHVIDLVKNDEKETLVVPCKRRANENNVIQIGWEKAEYLFGCLGTNKTEKLQKRASERHLNFLHYYKKLSEETGNTVVSAVWRALNNLDKKKFEDTDPQWKIIFRIDGQYLHEIFSYNDEPNDVEYGEDILTGEYGPIFRVAKTELDIKHVLRTKSTSCICFHEADEAIRRNGKIQGYSAPILQTNIDSIMSTINALANKANGNSDVMMFGEKLKTQFFFLISTPETDAVNQFSLLPLQSLEDSSKVENLIAEAEAMELVKLSNEEITGNISSLNSPNTPIITDLTKEAMFGFFVMQGSSRPSISRMKKVPAIEIYKNVIAYHKITTSTKRDNTKSYVSIKNIAKSAFKREEKMANTSPLLNQ